MSALLSGEGQTTAGACRHGCADGELVIAATPNGGAATTPVGQRPTGRSIRQDIFNGLGKS